MSLRETDRMRLKPLLSHLRRNYSPYIYISGYDRDTSTVSLGIEIHEIVLDNSEKDKSTVKYVPIDEIASLTWTQVGGKIRVSGLTLSQFTKKVRSRYTSITERSHKALLPSLYKQLVTIPDVDVNMRPLRTILVGITRNGSFPSDSFRRPPERAEQVRNYFTLLSDMNYIRHEGGGYVAGPAMRNLEATNIEPYELYRHILADVLKEHSQYLKEIMHWTMITPFLRWSHSYYRPALEAKGLIEVKQTELASYYNQFYGPWRVTANEDAQIDCVVQARILEYTKGQSYLHGYQPILDEYVSNVSKDPMLGSILLN